MQSKPSIPLNAIAYGIACLFLLASFIAGINSGLFASINWETAFYVFGTLGLLILLALAGNGKTVSINFVITRLILGIFALGVSLYYSWLFISAGAAGTALTIAAVFVLVTESAKILFLNDAMYYGAIGQQEKSLWLMVTVLVLFALSITATAHFLITTASVGHAEARQNENRYQILHQRLDGFTADIAAAQADKAQCPKNYITHCIKPAQARIDQLRLQQQAVQQQIANYKPSTGGIVFWQRMGEMMGISSAQAETAFSFLRGILLEILGLVLVAQASTGARLKQYEATHGVGTYNDNRTTTDVDAAALAHAEKSALAHNNSAHSTPNVAASKSPLTAAVGQPTYCEHCGSEYIKRANNQRFCSDECRVTAWEQKTGKRVKRPQTAKATA